MEEVNNVRKKIDKIMQEKEKEVMSIENDELPNAQNEIETNELNQKLKKSRQELKEIRDDRSKIIGYLNKYENIQEERKEYEAKVIEAENPIKEELSKIGKTFDDNNFLQVFEDTISSYEDSIAELEISDKVENQEKCQERKAQVSVFKEMLNNYNDIYADYEDILISFLNLKLQMTTFHNPLFKKYDIDSKKIFEEEYVQKNKREQDDSEKSQDIEEQDDSEKLQNKEEPKESEISQKKEGQKDIENSENKLEDEEKNETETNVYTDEMKKAEEDRIMSEILGAQREQGDETYNHTEIEENVEFKDSVAREENSSEVSRPFQNYVTEINSPINEEFIPKAEDRKIMTDDSRDIEISNFSDERQQIGNNLPAEMDKESLIMMSGQIGRIQKFIFKVAKSPLFKIKGKTTAGRMLSIAGNTIKLPLKILAKGINKAWGTDKKIEELYSMMEEFSPKDYSKEFRDRVRAGIDPGRIRGYEQEQSRERAVQQKRETSRDDTDEQR